MIAIKSTTSLTWSIHARCTCCPPNIRMLQQALTPRCRSCSASSRCPSVSPSVGVGSAGTSATLATAVSSASAALRFLQPHQYPVLAVGLWSAVSLPDIPLTGIPHAIRAACTEQAAHGLQVVPRLIKISHATHHITPSTMHVQLGTPAGARCIRLCYGGPVMLCAARLCANIGCLLPACHCC